MSAPLPLWPLRRTADAVAVLARAVGWSLPTAVFAPPQPAGLSAAAREGTPGSLADYLDAVAGAFSLESEPISVRIAEAKEFLSQSAPALILIHEKTEGMLVVHSVSGDSMRVVTPDGMITKISLDQVERVLLAPSFAPLLPEIERLLTATGVTDADRRAHAIRVILEKRLADERIDAGFILRLSAGRPIPQQLKDAGLYRLLSQYAGAHLAQYVLGILLYTVIGEGALSGRIDKGWLFAGLLLMFCGPPFQLIESWILGRIAIAMGVLLRRRLLFGAMNLPLDAARQSGYGDFICQIIESEVVEMGLRQGGLSAGAALLDLLGTLLVLSAVSRAALIVLLLWLLLVVGVSALYYRSRGRWTESRFRVVSELLEQMLGHRTRLVQEPRSVRHRAEDHQLVEYHQLGRGLDGWSAILFGALPFGWLLTGVVSLTPLWMESSSSSSRLAIGFGGVMLGFRALSKLASGLSQLGGVAIALRRCRHLLSTADPRDASPLTAVTPNIPMGAVVLDARRITVRHGNAVSPTLRELSFQLRAGQRVLLQGASGSGKSTMASTLTGLIPIESGQLLLGGLDMSALGGRKWRKIVATAPQFHENHLFSQPLAFNLLLGRAWPPSAEDLREAEQLCVELGLGPLLQRMPSGMYTHVGETGWQLSHGERSRVFIARALLQRAQVVLLDESFAALDPETLATTLQCVFRRVPTLLVIAHP